MTQHDIIMTTVAAWGASEGISRQAAHAAVRRCGIPVEGGRLDPAVATLLYRQRTRPRARTKAPAAAAAPEADERITYQEAKRREAAAGAMTAEINLAILRKRAMWTEDAVHMWQSLAVAVKAALLNLPTRMAPVVAAETDTFAVQQLLQAEVRRILTDLAKGVAAAEATVEPQHGDA